MLTGPFHDPGAVEEPCDSKGIVASWPGCPGPFVDRYLLREGDPDDYAHRVYVCEPHLAEARRLGLVA